MLVVGGGLSVKTAVNREGDDWDVRTRVDKTHGSVLTDERNLGKARVINPGKAHVVNWTQEKVCTVCFDSADTRAEFRERTVAFYKTRGHK